MERLKKELKEKSEWGRQLEDRVKSLTVRVSRLSERRDSDCKLSFMRMSGTESSKTTHNISVEEKLNKFHADLGQLTKIGEMAKRVTVSEIKRRRTR